MLELSLEADTVEIVGSHLWDCHNSWFAGELGWLWAELGMIMSTGFESSLCKSKLQYPQMYPRIRCGAR